MRAAVLVLMVAFCFIPVAKAAEPHWCAVWTDGSRNCAFPTMARCQEATSGAGGHCIEETANAQVRKPGGATNEDLDRLLDRINKKSDSLNLCRGC